MIDGVTVVPLRRIADERGTIMHGVRSDTILNVRIDPHSKDVPYDWARRDF